MRASVVVIDATVDDAIERPRGGTALSITPPERNGLQVATVIPAEGAILERVLETAHAIFPDGLSRQAYAKFHAAQIKTAWGRRHQRRFALVQDGVVLASAMQYQRSSMNGRYGCAASDPSSARLWTATVAMRSRSSGGSSSKPRETERRWRFSFRT